MSASRKPITLHRLRAMHAAGEKIAMLTCYDVLAAPAPVAQLPDAPLDYRDRYERLTGVSLRDCPHCGRGQMVRIESLLPGTLPRGPPPIAP